MVFSSPARQLGGDLVGRAQPLPLVRRQQHARQDL
jgi:hypothetical protein